MDLLLRPMEERVMVSATLSLELRTIWLLRFTMECHTSVPKSTYSPSELSYSLWNQAILPSWKQPTKILTTDLSPQIALISSGNNTSKTMRRISSLMISKPSSQVCCNCTQLIDLIYLTSVSIPGWKAHLAPISRSRPNARDAYNSFKSSRMSKEKSVK